MKKRLLLLIAVLLALGAGYHHFAGEREAERIATPLPAARVLADAAAGIDSERLMRDLHTLASPGFEGRRTASAGGLKARAFVLARFQELGLIPFGATHVQPFSFTHTSLKALVMPGKPYQTEYADAANVIGYIKGSRVPARYIVISAHYDHLGVREGKVFHGADDNASGVAGLLALAAHFRQHPPEHSIVFAAFDAEELGMRGAQAFLASPPFPREQLVMNLNLDMLGRSDEKAIFVAGTSYTPQFTALLAQAALRSTVKVKLGHDRPMWVGGSVEDWTGSSDHGPFHEIGVPFLYFGVEDHVDYHAPTDTADKIDAGFLADVVRLVIDVAQLLDRRSS